MSEYFAQINPDGGISPLLEDDGNGHHIDKNTGIGYADYRNH